MRAPPMSGGAMSDISPLSSGYGKANLTFRGGLNNSLLVPVGQSSLQPGGTVQLFGKTTLFSRVALSPGGTLADKAKAVSSRGGGP